jgi:spore germination protein GerM
MKRATLVLIGVVLAVALLAACGVPSDSQPRDIRNEQRLELAEAPAAQAANAPGPKVYFLATDSSGDVERLQPSSRDVAADPNAVLMELFKGLTREEQGRRWRTAIPNETTLLTAPVLRPDGTLVVDVNKALQQQATGESQIEAVAQIVFTATALEGVRRVELRVEGQTQDWLKGDNTAQPQDQPLTRYLYPELDPDSQPDTPPIPSPTTIPVVTTLAPLTSPLAPPTPSTAEAN